MTRRSPYLKAATTLLAGALLATCTNELEPTGAITVTLAKGAAWPDTLAVAEIATLAVTVTGPNQQAVTGVTLEWGSSDSSVVIVTGGASPLKAIVDSRRSGTATIVVRVVQTGFQPVELRAPVVVRERGADSLLSVGDVDTIGLVLQRVDPAFLTGATVTWGSSDPSVVGVSALASDSIRAVITGRFSGTAQVTATVQNQLGRSTFQLPVTVLPLEISELPAWAPTVNRTNTAAFAVQVKDALGRIRTGVRVQWHSTNETAFTVDSTGTVLGKIRGGGELVASVGVAPFQVVEHRAPLQVTEKWKAVSAGGDHTCAIAALDGCDVVVDCLDTLRARFEVEDACRTINRPMVSAAVAGASGHVTTIFPEDLGLRMIYGDPQNLPLKGAEATLGTVPYSVFLLASLECAEVAKIILGSTADSVRPPVLPACVGSLISSSAREPVTAHPESKPRPRSAVRGEHRRRRLRDHFRNVLRDWFCHRRNGHNHRDGRFSWLPRAILFHKLFQLCPIVYIKCRLP